MTDNPRFSFNRKEFMAYWLDTPMHPPESAEKRLNLRPGTCVKTPYACGRVHRNEKLEICVVIGHGWNMNDEERFVWRGSHEEFQRTWSID